MAALTGLTIIKRFDYRGNANEKFSNTYWLSGSVPSDAAAWRALFDALVAQEKTILPSWVSTVGGYGYDSDSDGATAVWSVDLTVSPNSPVAGTLSGGTGVSLPGDCAFWVRWGLDKLNSKGKRIYLRKYFHAAWRDATHVDQLDATQAAAAQAFGLKMHDGSFTGSRHVVDRKSSSTAILNHGVSTYVTTRTLKRRGKRH